MPDELKNIEGLDPAKSTDQTLDGAASGDVILEAVDDSAAAAVGRSDVGAHDSGDEIDRGRVDEDAGEGNDAQKHVSTKRPNVFVAVSFLICAVLIGVVTYLFWPQAVADPSIEDLSPSEKKSVLVPVYTDIIVPGWTDGDLPIKVRIYKAGSGTYGEYEVRPTDTRMITELAAGRYEACVFAPILKDGTVFKPLEKVTFTIEEGKDKYTIKLTFEVVLQADITDALINEVLAPWSMSQREEMRGYLIVAAEGQSGQVATGNGSGTEDPSGNQGGFGGNGGSSGGSSGGNSGGNSGGSGGSGGGGSTGLVWHPPWTETIYHPAEYGEIWHPEVGHYGSVCNECGAEISGFAAKHLEETLHRSYRTAYIVDSPAWSETVVVREAWTEYINHPGYWG